MFIYASAIALLLIVASAATLAYAVKHAEDGYEDETGFHSEANRASAALSDGWRRFSKVQFGGDPTRIVRMSPRNSLDG